METAASRLAAAPNREPGVFLGFLADDGVCDIEGSDVAVAIYGTTGHDCKDASPGHVARTAIRPHGDGTVFQMDLSGSERLLYTFTGDNGAFPYRTPIVLKGSLYGTTSEGGSSTCGCGVVFEVPVQGVGGKTLYAYSGPDGAHPYANLIVWKGVLYGTTRDGGANAKGTIFSLDPSSDAEDVLYSFRGPDGAHPYAPLTAWHGALYGATYDGGHHNEGTVYELIK